MAENNEDYAIFELWNEEYMTDYRKNLIEKLGCTEEDSDAAFTEFVKLYKSKMTLRMECLSKKKKFNEKKNPPETAVEKPVEKKEKAKAAVVEVESNDMKVDAAEEKKEATTEEKSSEKKVVASEKKPKNTAKRAKVEKEPEIPLIRNMLGWHKVSTLTDQKKEISMEKLTDYVKDPNRAKHLLASIVAHQLQENTPVFDDMCKTAFLDGLMCDGKGGDGIAEDLSTSKNRQVYLNEKTTELKKKLHAANAEYYGTSMDSARLNIDAGEKLREEVCRTIPFNSVVPYALDNTTFQVYVIAFQPAGATDVSVISLPKTDQPKFFVIHERRAFVNSSFSDEVDSKGVALMDLCANGFQICKDAKIDAKELYAAYMDGNSAAIFEWFKKTFPAACDESAPVHLKSDFFKMSVVVKNLEKYKEPPSTKKTKAKQTKSKAKDTEAVKEGQEAVEGQRTIKQFATNVNKIQPKKSKVAQNPTFLVLDKSNEEFASIVDYIENSLKQTGFGEEIDRKFPISTQEDILSLVMPHTESKAANSMSKKNQKKNQKKNGEEVPTSAASAANEDEGADAGKDDEQQIPESARSQYQAYSAQIPKASRTLFMGNDLSNKLNNLTDDYTAPPTKAASDVKVQTNFARAAYFEKFGTDGAITDGATLAKVLDGVSENDPQSIVRLLMSKKYLERFMFRLAFDAQRRNEFKAKEDNIAEYFSSDKFCKFLAECLTLDALLGFCLISYNTDLQKANFESSKKMSEKIDIAKGWF